MNDLVKELKEIMKEKYLSAEATSRFIGCSAMTVNRWLYGKAIPSRTSQRRIKRGIEKIKESYLEKTHRDLFKETKAFYLKIKNILTEEEKEKVQELHLLYGPEVSLKMLQELEEKHRLDGE